MKFLQLIALMLLFATTAYAQVAPPAPVEKEPIVNYGFTAGMLVIPFKFHPQDHALTGGGTLGGYIGWKTSWMGLTITPIASAGLSLSDAQYGTGFSMSGGFIGSVGTSAMHFGVVFGTDYYAKQLNYPYDGKLWIAAEVGYNFGQ